MILREAMKDEGLTLLTRVTLLYRLFIRFDSGASASERREVRQVLENDGCPPFLLSLVLQSAVCT